MVPASTEPRAARCPLDWALLRPRAGNPCLLFPCPLLPLYGVVCCVLLLRTGQTLLAVESAIASLYFVPGSLFFLLLLHQHHTRRTPHPFCNHCTAGPINGEIVASRCSQLRLLSFSQLQRTPSRHAHESAGQHKLARRDVWDPLFPGDRCIPTGFGVRGGGLGGPQGAEISHGRSHRWTSTRRSLSNTKRATGRNPPTACLHSMCLCYGSSLVLARPATSVWDSSSPVQQSHLP